MSIRRFNKMTGPVKLAFVFSVFLLVVVVGMALASPLWLGGGATSHAAPGGAVTQQGISAVMSQGLAAHGVRAWHLDGHGGGAVKVGIINSDFKGLSGLMGGELPSNTPTIKRVEGQCYTAVGVHTSKLSDCENKCTVDCPGTVGHGTAVAEIIADVAPEASLYISNTSKFTDEDDLKETVKWMVEQGVKVINHSIGIDINAPGDGSSGLPVSDNHILDVIDYAVSNGIIWVNSGGNDARRTWYGPYKEGTSNNTWHDFGTSSQPDEGNTVHLEAGKPMYAELRWQDSWSGADCDLDLYLKRTGANGNAAFGLRPQTGQDKQTPYEILTFEPMISGNYYLSVQKYNCADTPDWMQLRLTNADRLGQESAGHHVGVPAEVGQLIDGVSRT